MNHDILQSVQSGGKSSSSVGGGAAASKGLGPVIRSCAARARGAVGVRVRPPLPKAVVDEEEESGDQDEEPVVKGVLSS